MRAINLVPADSRPGRVNGGKSGGVVYGFIGALVVLFLGLTLLASSKHKTSTTKQELAGVEQSTQAYTSVATQFSSFEAAASQATQRISTVTSLAQARFDWAGAMREFSRLVPTNTQVLSLDASVKPDVDIGTGGSTLRAALDVPAITIDGCSKSQNSVANLVTSLQAMRRVTNVTLSKSEISDDSLPDVDTPEEAAAKVNGDTTTTTTPSNDSNTGSGGDDNCSLTGVYYKFNATVFFAAGASQSSEDVAPSSTPAGASTISTESAGAAVPAASTPTTAAGN